MSAKIDLRPHYTFAFFSESAEFGLKTILYYSRKDMTLHYISKASIYDYINEGDKSYIQPITNGDAELLRKSFELMIESYQHWLQSHDPQIVLDGSYCVVISGRKRINFEGPLSDDNLNSFCDMIYQLMENIEKNNDRAITDCIMQIPTIINNLKESAL